MIFLLSLLIAKGENAESITGLDDLVVFEIQNKSVESELQHPLMLVTHGHPFFINKLILILIS